MELNSVFLENSEISIERKCLETKNSHKRRVRSLKTIKKEEKWNIIPK
jgi:hypothetical protein